MYKYLQYIFPLLFLIFVVFSIAQKLQHSQIQNSGSQLAQIPAADNSLENFYASAQQLAGQNQPQTQTLTTTFLAVGDIMLSRNVAAVTLNGIPSHGPHSLDYPFQQMSDVLKSTDFNFANLESPFDPNFNGIVGGHSLTFGAPTNLVSDLTDYNFKILNLANNHAFDLGLKGLDFTRKSLDNQNIAHEGTGDNLDEAWTPAVVTSNGIKICFVGASYASANDGGKIKNDYVARMEDIENLKLKIENSKSLCDFVVVTMHGGVEYTRTPDDLQIKFARAAIDDGADVVIGAHPHWVQTIERYCQGSNTTSPQPSPYEGRVPVGREGLQTDCANPKYIFYSLGNFIFDQDWSQETKEGLALKITLSKDVVQAPGLQQGRAGQGPALQGPRTFATLNSIQLIPVIINNSQPRPATADETKKILEKIGQTEATLK